jgi:ATP-grasp domain
VAIAIISRGPVTRWRFHEWLEGVEDDLHLFTVAPPPGPMAPALQEALSHYASVRFYEQMVRNCRPELDILDLAERCTLRGLVDLVEWDLERAAALRDRLGLPGQGSASARAYRDKALMKDLLGAAGLPVAAHRPARTILDVADHAREHGYPVVVKPRNCAGAMDVRIIHHRAQLDALAEEGLAPRIELPAHLVVESFVEGHEYIVDGLVCDGRLVYAWPSRYVGAPTEFTRDGRHLGAVMLDVDHPLRLRLQELARAVVAALPSPRCFPFHLEVFHTPDDRLVLGEIGARTGGARIDHMCLRVFGIQPNRVMALDQAGCHPELPPLDDVAHIRRAGLGGWVGFLGRAGEARRLPPPPTEPWVLDWWLDAKVGGPVRAPWHSSDSFASAVVLGRSSAEVGDRIGALADWLWSQVEIGTDSAVTLA